MVPSYRIQDVLQRPLSFPDLPLFQTGSVPADIIPSLLMPSAVRWLVKSKSPILYLLIKWLFSSTFGEVSPWRSGDIESVFPSLKEHKRCAGKRSERYWRGRLTTIVKTEAEWNGSENCRANGRFKQERTESVQACLVSFKKRWAEASRVILLWKGFLSSNYSR